MSRKEIVRERTAPTWGQGPRRPSRVRHRRSWATAQRLRRRSRTAEGAARSPPSGCSTGTASYLKSLAPRPVLPLRHRHLGSTGTCSPPTPRAWTGTATAEVDLQGTARRAFVDYPRMFKLPLGSKYVKERFRKFYERAHDDAEARHLAHLRPNDGAARGHRQGRTPPVLVRLRRHWLQIQPPGKPQPTRVRLVRLLLLRGRPEPPEGGRPVKAEEEPLLRQYDRWWFGYGSATSLGVFRILFAEPHLHEPPHALSVDWSSLVRRATASCPRGWARTGSVVPRSCGASEVTSVGRASAASPTRAIALGVLRPHDPRRPRDGDGLVHALLGLPPRRSCFVSLHHRNADRSCTAATR